ncbi:hypothetical protein D6T64_12010 [Cryobacterium melibiosiphilum]|uniref:Helix-turn-helix domain-containing protein n=1 Tax=Cryobacterium melibiosiphilum TaxID=995039 RepID=A0A3A5MDA5_9MICO|nr:hypothetical protein D6T64_12010 [Cryobacterium melibiosiphilum]
MLIAEFAEKAAELNAELADVAKSRNKLIRHMLRLGATPSELSHVTGMSRMRIYQIKDGK